MERKIIKISKEKCNGCGLCVSACHEGAIALIEGKAKLIRDDYCDGLGDCLPTCPTSAITFEVREALAYDMEAVKANQSKKETLACGCPGSQSKVIHHVQPSVISSTAASQLMQWPVQIQLVPLKAAYFNNANLVIAADCSAYAYGNFHQKFMRNNITIIGCPKLDPIDYSEKLTAILENNDIKSVCVVSMEVPCCGGIEQATKTALQNSGKIIPRQFITISTEGNIIE